MSYRSSGAEHSLWCMSCTCSISCSSEKASACPVPLRKWGEEHQCHLLSFLSELQIIASHHLWQSPFRRGVIYLFLPWASIRWAAAALLFHSVVPILWSTCLVWLVQLKLFAWSQRYIQLDAALICWLLGVASSTDTKLAMRRFWGTEYEYIMA